MYAATLHVTLAFVGTISHERLPQLKSAARVVSAQPFDLVLDSVQYWDHNRIVYAEPSEPPPRLMQLAADLVGRLRSSGVMLEDRAYRPHVTLLRNARWPDAPLPVLPPVAWRVAEFALIQSLPQQYRPLAHFHLGVTGQ
jgi:2'-5' RNA ligase